MGATAASCGSSPFIPRENSLAGYIKGFSKLVAQNQLEGILATAWMMVPHTLKRCGVDTSHRENMAGTQQHGQSNLQKPTCPTRIWLSSKWQPYSFLDELEQAFFFDDALVNWEGAIRHGELLILLNQPTGSRRTRSMEPYLPTKNSPSKGGTKTIWKICQGIKEAKQHALRNRYTLEVYWTDKPLFNFPVRLILALHNYDITIHEQDKQTTLQQINEVCKMTFRPWETIGRDLFTDPFYGTTTARLHCWPKPPQPSCCQNQQQRLGGIIMKFKW